LKTDASPAPVTTTPNGFVTTVTYQSIATCTMVNRVPPAPSIDIQKATNGSDADAPPGPAVPIGSAVAWTYLVTNTGNDTLSTIVVTDNRAVTWPAALAFAALGALFVPTMALTLTALSVVTKSGLASVFNPGAHGFTEALYAYTSQSNNNGSAFAGYGATNFSAELGAVAMYLGRFAPLLAALALGGALAGKKTVPASVGTFRTDGPTFVVLLVGVILLTAGLMVFPALTLGPIVEGLSH